MVILIFNSDCLSGHPWIMADGLAPDKPLDHSVISRLTQFCAMNKLKKMALRVRIHIRYKWVKRLDHGLSEVLIAFFSSHIQVIAERLSEEEIAGLKEMFKMIDTDNSGQITFEELKNGLKRFGANLEESEIHYLMQSVSFPRVKCNLTLLPITSTVPLTSCLVQLGNGSGMISTARGKE